MGRVGWQWEMWGGDVWGDKWGECGGCLVIAEGYHSLQNIAHQHHKPQPQSLDLKKACTKKSTLGCVQTFINLVRKRRVNHKTFFGVHR